MGTNTLVRNAQEVAKIEITHDEAEAFRQRVLTEIYPTLATLWKKTCTQLLPTTWERHAKSVESNFPPDEYALLQLRRIVAGETASTKDKPYGKWKIDDYFEALKDINQNGNWSKAIEGRDDKVLPGLFQHPQVVSQTGRVRGRVNYSTYRNTQFQSLAADGAKLAMWELHRRGYRIAFYVHDEFGISASGGQSTRKM